MGCFTPLLRGVLSGCKYSPRLGLKTCIHKSSVVPGLPPGGQVQAYRLVPGTRPTAWCLGPAWDLAYRLVPGTRPTAWCLGPGLPPGAWVQAYRLVPGSRPTAWCQGPGLPPGTRRKGTSRRKWMSFWCGFVHSPRMSQTTRVQIPSMTV